MSNPIFEAGFFFLLLGLALFFTFYTFKKLGNASGFLRIISMALFSILAIIISSGDEVAQTVQPASILHYNTTSNKLVSNDTATAQYNVVIPGGTQSYWVAWLFGGFAILNVFLLLQNFWGGT